MDVERLYRLSLERACVTCVHVLLERTLSHGYACLQGRLETLERHMDFDGQLAASATRALAN